MGYFYRATLSPGEYLAIGPGGDDDPGRVLADVVLVATGDDGVRVGASLSGVAGSRSTTVPAGGALPLAGVHDALVLMVPSGASGAVDVSINASHAECGANSGRKLGPIGAVDVGEVYAYTTVRAASVAGANTPTTVPSPRKRRLSAIKVLAESSVTGASITMTFVDSLGRTLATTVNLESLTPGTPAAATLTTDTAALWITDDITITVLSSDGGDTIGPLLVELRWEGN